VALYKLQFRLLSNLISQAKLEGGTCEFGKDAIWFWIIWAVVTFVFRAYQSLMPATGKVSKP